MRWSLTAVWPISLGALVMWHPEQSFSPRFAMGMPHAGSAWHFSQRDCANAVSRLHGAVNRRIFQPLFPRWPESEVPITHITNGVHVPSWDSAWADGLWTGACDPFAERVVLEFHHLVWDHVLKDIGCSLRPGGTSRNGSHSFHVLRIAAGNA